MTTRFGVFVPQGWRMDLAEIDDPIEQFETMTRVARAADEGGWDSIWVFDHFHTTPTPELETCFEAWTISATLARDTHNVKIGQMVGCNGYRNPALYAKMASTVDVASHGRLYAGIGAGWYEHEWRAYGYGYPETPERMRMFREAVEIIRKMCDVLRRHCDALGRDYDEIIKSTEINCLLLDGETDRERTIAPIRELVGMSDEEFSENYWVG